MYLDPKKKHWIYPDSKSFLQNKFVIM